MTKTLPALKARQSSFHRQDVLCITKPSEGLKGGEVGLFWDQETGLELLRRVNAYPKLVEALRAYVAAINDNQFAKNYVRERTRRDARALLRELGEDA